MDKRAEWPIKADIHPMALVSPHAELAEGVRIGPWCSVGPHVRLGKGVRLHASVMIEGHTVLEEGVEVYPFTTIGMAPQDLKYAGEPTCCHIGRNSILREHVTVHRGTVQGHSLTQIGKDCLIMANAHVAHDCKIGNGVIIVNNVVMGGHVVIEDNARIMGSAALHQFVRIGCGSVIGGLCGVEMDVIPYGSVLGNRARLVGLNWVGLKRSGVGHEDLQLLRRAFRELYPRGAALQTDETVLRQRIGKVRELYGHSQHVGRILAFMETPGIRGLTRAARSNSVFCHGERDMEGAC